MEKTIKVLLAAAGISMLSACGSGSSSSSVDATGCVSFESVSGGANFTNNCDFKVNVALFDPLFRFDLEPMETEFLAINRFIVSFGVCKAPSKPKDEGGGEFVCD